MTDPTTELQELDPNMPVREQLRELATSLEGLTDALLKEPTPDTIERVAPVQRAIAHCLRVAALLSRQDGEREASTDADAALELVRYLDRYWRTDEADPCPECGAVLYNEMNSSEGCDLCKRDLWPIDLERASGSPDREAPALLYNWFNSAAQQIRDSYKVSVQREGLDAIWHAYDPDGFALAVATRKYLERVGYPGPATEPDASAEESS